jgi:hypothetical protein
VHVSVSEFGQRLAFGWVESLPCDALSVSGYIAGTGGGLQIYIGWIGVYCVYSNSYSPIID